MSPQTMPNALFAATLLLILASALALRCETSADCDDNVLCTIDFCEQQNRRCINVATEPSCNALQRQIPLGPFVDVVNEVPIPLDERVAIIRQVSVVLLEVHPHRSLHLNFLGVDPVLALSQLEEELLAGAAMTNVEFHERISFIFQTMDDFHTTYRKPTPLMETRAFMPFTIRDFFVGNGSRQYVVTDVGLGATFANPNFTIGSVITKWNGEPVDDVVRQLGRDGFGSNEGAQIEVGMGRLRVRFLGVHPIPEEGETPITISFSNEGRSELLVDVPFTFAMTIANATLGAMSSMGIELPDDQMVAGEDEELEWEHDTRPENSTGPLERPSAQQLANLAMETDERQPVPVEDRFCGVFTAEIVPTTSGPIGRLILSSFFTTEPFSDTVLEFARVLTLMPENGLVVDVRTNGGGFVLFAKFFAELLSTNTIDFLPFDLRASSLMERAVNATGGTFAQEEDNMMWRPSMRTARATGDPYTGTFEFSDDSAATRLQAVYSGPYVVLADGMTFSAGDIFTSLHQDNNIAPVVVTGTNIGAGGSSVLGYVNLQERFPGEFPISLPAGVGMTTSFLRVLRAGENTGAILENFGIVPDVVYRPTFADRVGGERDLFNELGMNITTRTTFNVTT